jgi:hypothetical protein
MEQVGQQVPLRFRTARYSLGGAGTQTAALAFGGNPDYSSIQMQQKNIMVLLGQVEIII